MALNMHQHGINRSLILHLRKKFPEARVDLKYDGYVIPDKRPLILIEPLINVNESETKQRQSIEVSHHYQIGLFDANSVQLSINQERLADVFNFDRIIYYDTLKTPIEQAGSFLCVLNDITPIFSDDLTKKSEFYRVYFDVEIINTKRSR